MGHTPAATGKTAGATPDNGDGVKLNSIRRTLRIIETICREKSGLTVSELARRHDVSAPLMHSYVRSILEEGYIYKDRDTGKVHPTFKIVGMGNQVVSNNEITEICHPTLSDLCRRFHSAVHLAVKEGDLGICVDKIGHTDFIPSITRIGMSFDLYATALGKALLAFMSQDEIEDYLSRVELIPYTRNTIVDKARLLRELNAIRRNGYSVDNGEHRMDLQGMGVPIFDYSDRPIAALSILLPYGADHNAIRRLYEQIRPAVESMCLKFGHIPSHGAAGGGRQKTSPELRALPSAFPRSDRAGSSLLRR